MRIEVRGKTYKDAHAAARALGVSVSTIYTALHRGTIDRVGIGAGRGTRDASRQEKPVRIGPLTWRSRKDCAADLGVDERYVGKVLREGGKRSRANLLRLVMEFYAKGGLQGARCTVEKP